ncbi:alanine--tRNA ligase [Candidatus Gottesmanbacteria bacterium]|nr:alanine--tRNA ligase [Candidatus Gottesmanbacteria bacterium]MBI5452168.1 alanine--tRNA ligase [Candidatus Gottesmanbacteria bacterium]
MTHTDLRKKFIEFFTTSSRNHKEIPSAPLVPENDPTSLFTSSGMQPLINYLLGETHPLGTRLVNSQKCFRSQDIEEVGDNRHTTFFEMLGNWSLGDYFKKEQLPWNFEFLTQEIGLDPQRLYVTVFEGDKSVSKDTESIAIWKEIFIDVGIDAKVGERIFAYPAKKNWWSRSGEPENMPPNEPGGPDSEVFFDFGQDLKLHEKSPFKNQKCHPNCDCGRFLEIANSVFMQYQKQKDGTLKELPNKNVDFGGGLERMLAATLDNSDIFQTDLYSQIIETIYKVSGKSYKEEENKPPMRIIADHLKAATFMVADKVEPSNKQQGYILRRLLRRAAVKYRLLTNVSITEQDLLEIVESVLKTYENTFYFKNINHDVIKNVIGSELFRFTLSLDKGMREIQKISRADGKIAFDLYQTYGFPLEITAELFARKGQKIDIKQFEQEFKKHRELSRTATKGIFKGGLQDQSEETTRLHTATHLLQQALRTVLGDHIRQKGSHITAERLRFDFSHPHKLTANEIKKIEDLINKQIEMNLPVSMKIINLAEAIREGALTVPGVNYPEKVKVYSVGNPSTGSGQVFSKEVCGGPHVDFTAGLGKFKIIKEEAQAAGIRRIYAILQTNVPDKQNLAQKRD